MQKSRSPDKRQDEQSLASSHDSASMNQVANHLVASKKRKRENDASDDNQKKKTRKKSVDDNEDVEMTDNVKDQIADDNAKNKKSDAAASREQDEDVIAQDEWSIDTLLLKINEERKSHPFPEPVIANAKLVFAQFASRVGDLKNYTLEKLEAEGIKTSIATAIVEYINKHKPGGICTDAVPQELSKERKLSILHSLITVKSAEQVKKRQQSCSAALTLKFKSFVHREEGISMVQTVANKNWKAYMANSATKQEHTLLIASGGSGSGKTRASNEVGNILRYSALQNKIPHAFASTCESYIDFSTGDKINKWEYDLSSSRILGLRLFVKALCEEKTVKEFCLKVDENAVSRLSHQGVFDSELVLSLISNVYRMQLGLNEDEVLPFVVILDEFQQTIEVLPEKKEWKRIAKTMGEYMCKANNNLQNHRLLLIPVISGTLPSCEVSFELAQYGNVFFPLPPFPLQVCMDLAAQEGVQQCYLNSQPEIKRFWYLMGLVPRCLEFAVKEIEQFQTTTESLQTMQTDALFSKVMNSLNALYRLGQYFFASATDDPKLLWHVITGAVVPDTEAWISNLQREGRIYMDESRLLLPYPVLLKLSNNHPNILPPSCIPKLNASFSWRDFAKLDLRILAQRRNIAKSIRELFPGARGSKATLDTTVAPSSCKYTLEQNAYLVGEKNKFTVAQMNAPIHVEHRTNAIVGENRFNYVFQASKNHLLVDGRIFVADSKYETLVFFIQYKYSDDPNADHEEQVKVSPLTWYKTLVPTIKAAYKGNGNSIYFVYITNAYIPKKAADAVSKCTNLLVIDQSCAAAYFAPTIIPYYSTVIGDKKTGEKNEKK